MFEHLVESTSHKDDLARKGSFIMGTIAVYTVVLTGLFVMGIYLYDAQLENQNLELTTLIAPVPVPPAEKSAEAAKPQKVTTNQNVDVRKEVIQNMNESPIPPKEISAKASDIPPRRMGVQTIQGSSNSDNAIQGGPIGPGTGTGGGGGPSTPTVDMGDPPPPPPPKKPPAIVSGGVLNGKAISLPKPPYPPIARTARASGTVTVQVTIDENGNVISASAVSGHPLLRAAAVSAARGARFTPTKLSGQPVKVTGVINYNFGLN
jgi:periplasmic protein TonB